MKQFLALALLALTVLGVFYLMRRPDSGGQGQAGPAAPGAQLAGQPAPAPPAAGPGTQRPNVPKPRAAANKGAARAATDDDPNTVATKHGEARAVLPPELQALVDARNEFNWYDTVSAETLVRIEDAWDIDTDEVDWQADVLLTVNGTPITQQMLRRFAVLDTGALLVRSEVFAFAGQRIAKSMGQPYGLTDEQFDLYAKYWAERRGLDEENAELQNVLTTRLPPQAARKLRREMVETMLAFYPAAASNASELPREVVEVLSGRAIDDAWRIITMIRQSQSKGDQEQHMKDLVDLIEPLAHMWQLGIGEQETFRRSWSFLDADMPSDSVTAYAAGQVDPDRPEPPWNHAGEVRFVRTEPLWELIEPLMTPELLQRHLRQAIWSTVLRAELVKLSALPSADQAWMDFAREFLQGQSAVLGTSFIALGVHGFPSLAHYRDYKRILAGFVRSRPEGWGSEEMLREFFPRHRFFIQSWQPDIEVAWFPPRDLTKPIVGDGDWDYALAQANAFRAKVVEGGVDFSEAVAAHSKEVEEAIRQRLGPEEAQDFRGRFRSGHLNGTLREIGETLRETQYTLTFSCSSIVRNAVARLKTDDVSEPWRSQIGYVIVRMNRARLTGLEDEFEDLIEATRHYHNEVHFLKWVNGVLSGAAYQKP